MKSPKLHLTFTATALSLLCANASLQAQDCTGSESSQRRLSAWLKSPAPDLSAPALPCDTMEVLFGETVTLPAGTRLHFGNSRSGKGALLVKGTLRAEGTPENPLYLAGSWMPSAFGGKPGAQAWSGIQVAGSGSVNLTYARLYGAKQGIRAQEGRVKLSKVYFQGTSVLTLANGKSHPLNADGELVESLSSEPNPAWAGTGGKKAGSKVKPGSDADTASLSESKSGSAWPWVLGGLGLAAVAGGASAYLFWPESPDGNREEPEPLAERQPIPELRDDMIDR